MDLSSLKESQSYITQQSDLPVSGRASCCQTWRSSWRSAGWWEPCSEILISLALQLKLSHKSKGRARSSHKLSLQRWEAAELMCSRGTPSISCHQGPVATFMMLVEFFHWVTTVPSYQAPWLPRKWCVTLWVPRVVTSGLHLSFMDEFQPANCWAKRDVVRSTL